MEPGQSDGSGSRQIGPGDSCSDSLVTSIILTILIFSYCYFLLVLNYFFFPTDVRYLPTVPVLFKGFSIFVDQFHTISSAERRGSVEEEEEEEGAGEEEEEEEENKDKISKLTQIKVRQSFTYNFFHFSFYAVCSL